MGTTRSEVMVVTVPQVSVKALSVCGLQLNSVLGPGIFLQGH